MAEFYRIVRVRPNGTELVLQDIPFTAANEQQQRLAAFGGVPTGQHIRVYSSDENGVVTPDDVIWDSDINELP